MNDLVAATTWFICMQVLTIVLVPFLWQCIPTDGCRAYGVFKMASLLLVAGGILLLRFFFKENQNLDWLYLGTLTLIGAAGWLRILPNLGRDAHKRIISVESAMLAAYIGYLGFKRLTPAVYHTEQPMDFAILNSLTVGHGAATDPWLSGHTINYYYFGYYPYAVISQITSIPTSKAYNLSLATVWSLSLIATMSTLSVLLARVRPHYARKAGIISACVAILMMGNFTAVGRLWNGSFGDLASTSWWSDRGLGWSTTRVVQDINMMGDPVDTINEYPLFSFVLGDLHPHLLALPINIGYIGLLAGCVTANNHLSNNRLNLAAGIASGLILGFLIISNPWDAPIQFAVTFGFSLAMSRKRGAFMPWNAGVFFGTILPCMLFFTNYVPPFSGGGASIGSLLLPIGFASRVTRQLTSSEDFVAVWGIHLLVITCLTITLLLVCHIGRKLTRIYDIGTTMIPILFVLIYLTWERSAIVWAVAWMCLMTTVILIALFTLVPAPDVETVYIVPVLLGAGFIALAIPELVYIPDLFQSRMNTIFKFYYQGWIFLGLSLGVLVGHTLSCASRIPLQSARRWSTSLLVFGNLALVVTVGSVAPASAFQFWSTDRTQPHGLDATMLIPIDEQSALDWINAHTATDAVILESIGCSYRPLGPLATSRVSTFTGRPTVIGWVGHQQQWRSGSNEWQVQINERIEDVGKLLDNPHNLELIEKYSISYLYVGSLERDGAGPNCPFSPARPHLDARARESSLWSLAYQNDGVSIYVFKQP